jgi:hypothetical protein
VTTNHQVTAASVADVVTKLVAEYGERLSFETVSDIVVAAHRDLVGQVPDQALAEMLYRLARERLGA